MKETYIKKLNELLFDENTKIVPLKTENGNILYIKNDQIIDYDCEYEAVVRERVSFVFESLEELARELDVEVIFGHNGYEFPIYPYMRVSRDRIMGNQDVNNAYYRDMIRNEKIEKILNNATVENIASELKRIKELKKMKKIICLYPGLEPHKKTTPSKRLYELYKMNQPDAYLDGMVEEAKVLKKEQF